MLLLRINVTAEQRGRDGTGGSGWLVRTIARSDRRPPLTPTPIERREPYMPGCVPGDRRAEGRSF